MHRVIYLDSFLLLNFLMDGAALLITARILTVRIKWRRLLAASVLGALFSLFPVFFPGLGLLPAALGFLPMNLIAFGKTPPRRFFLICLFQFLSSLVLGGAVEVLYNYAGRSGEVRRVTPGIFLFCLCLGLGAFSLWGKSARRRLESCVVSITIRRGDARADAYALVDSGSLLREPVSGDPVILMKAEAARDLFTPGELSALERGDAAAGFPLLAIPLRTASGAGVLFGFRPTLVGLHHRAFKKAYRETRSAVVALDFSGGAFAGCSCLVPLSMI
ncbi:MAG: sigma-E processing peptidase SpoIIGA [Clostridia bacterium]|nr:sigma-E processing peptidase SpoIIGA [Clostridia bacterium]